MAVDSKSFTPMTLTVVDDCGLSSPRSALSDAMSVFTPSPNYLTPQNPGTIQVLIHLPGTQMFVAFCLLQSLLSLFLKLFTLLTAVQFLISMGCIII